MPTYEYECKGCGYSFEVFQAMSDEPLKTCARCGKEVRRLIFGGAGVIFKGSGFYVTDKGKGNAPAATSAPAVASAAKTAKPESKTTDTSAAPVSNSAPAGENAATPA